MSIFTKIWSGIKWVGRIFTTQASQDALKLVSSFIPQVMPIVTAIHGIVPSVKTATIGDIIEAYAAFGVSVGNIKEDPAEFGRALASLALTVAKDRLKVNGIADRYLNAAIDLALIDLKAK